MKAWSIVPPCILATAAVALALTARSADASTVTKTYNFSLSNFAEADGTGISSPISSITGSFRLTFDPNSATSDDTTHIVTNSFVVNPSSSADFAPIAFSTDPAGSITIGSSVNDVTAIVPGSNDFVLQLLFPGGGGFDNPALATCADSGFSCSNGSGLSSFLASGYTLASDNASGWFATTGSVSETPIPATLPLFGSALATLGFVSLRRKRSAGPAA
jgi:hypothetical protein